MLNYQRVPNEMIIQTFASFQGFSSVFLVTRMGKSSEGTSVAWPDGDVEIVSVQELYPLVMTNIAIENCHL